MVARQFRVLEAASSSPATSTKKKRGCTPSFLFAVADRLELVLRAERSRIECANFAGERVKLACKPSAKLFCRRQSPRHTFFLARIDSNSYCEQSEAGSSALILQASASSSLVSRAQNYFASGKAPAAPNINSQVRNRRRFSPFFEHSAVYF